MGSTPLHGLDGPDVGLEYDAPPAGNDTILGDPRLRPLDEATGPRDTATERAVVEAPARPGKPRATGTIEHRLSTVRRTDRIVAPACGTVVEGGTHDDRPARDGADARRVRKAA